MTRWGKGMALVRTTFAIASLVSASAIQAQRTDTTRTDSAAPRPASVVPLPSAPAQAQPRTAAPDIPDSLRNPPLSPRRALVTSLLIPGYAQSKLRRPTSTMIFAAAELLSIGMARKAALDLREARRGSDSIVVAYTVDANTGAITPSAYAPSRFTPERVRARRTHYEDWIAAILLTHILSGIDAYVAANLWDFTANLDPARGTARVGARRAF